MDKEFHPVLYNRCNYLSILALKLFHVSKIEPRMIVHFISYPFEKIDFENVIILYGGDCVFWYPRALMVYQKKVQNDYAFQ